MQPIPNYPKYFATESGEIFGPKGMRKPQKHPGGYRITAMPSKKGFRSRYIHRLVWEAFKGSIPVNKQINHKDGNKINNKLSNLELVTAKENTKHAIENGLKDRDIVHLKVSEVAKIKELYNNGMGTRELAEKFNRSQRCIQHIASGKRWSNV